MRTIKTILSTFLLSLPVLTAIQAEAQTMKVRQGQLVTAIPAATASDMQFSEGGQTLSIMDCTFATATIDEITVDRTETTPRTLSVSYNPESGATQVTVTADVRPHLTIQINDAHVSVMAEPTYLEEISYELSGSSANGSFWMDGEYKAALTLRNLTLTNPDSAAVCIENGKRIDVIIPEATTTTLSDGAGGLHDACFFINGHAEFSGSGTLNLSGLTKHAYASDEYTLFKTGFGQFNVNSAASDGLHIEQYLQVDGGTFTIRSTKGDCFDVGVTKDRLDPFNGQAFINSGTLDLEVAADDVKGLKTDSAMTITGGTINALVSGLGTKGISVGTNLLINATSGSAPTIKMSVTGTTYMPGDATLESKCRGIKVKGNFTFDGGTINMSVTGQKAKGISVDGTWTYVSGTTNVLPS